MKKKSPPVGRTMRAAYKSDSDFRGTEIVKARELIETRFVAGTSPSLAARKVLNLLIGKAAGDAWKKGSHTITKRELRGSHQSNDRIANILDELMAVQFKLDTVSRRGNDAILTSALIAWNIEEKNDDDDSIIEWEFTAPARKVLKDSSVYAHMNRAALMAFDSKYAVTLYELGALFYGRRDPTWRGSVKDFREKIGVPEGKYRDWAQLKRKTLDQAKREIDQLADFDLTWQLRREGRKVVEIELQFFRKDNQRKNEAQRELERSRVGRKARRAGTVERLDVNLPEQGPVLDDKIIY